MYYLIGIIFIYLVFVITGSRRSRMKRRIRKTKKFDRVSVISDKEGWKAFIPYTEVGASKPVMETGDYDFPADWLISESKNFKVEKEFLDSKFTDEKMSFLTIVPKDYSPDKSYPYLLLLHGMRDNPRHWIEKARLLDHFERLLEKKEIGNMIIILPSSGYKRESWYSNFKKDPKKNYESFFIKELLPYIKGKYNLKKGGIAGFSMGGYGAFKLALKNLDQFTVIGSFAGAVSLVRLTINKRITRIVKFIYLPSFLFRERDKENFIKIFGSWGKEIIKEDPYTLVKYLNKHEQQKKQFYLSVGSEDKAPYNMVHQWVDMVGRLKRFNLPYEAKLYEGEIHRWEFISKDLENFLKFSWRHLK